MNQTSDLQKIQDLLKRNRLPYGDLKSSKVKFIIKESNGHLMGCIGVEKYGADGLLRSLAVDENYKDNGIGKQLLTELFQKSEQEGMNKLHLLTTTADTYFKRFGFETVDRSNAPKAILQTKEFSEICPASSVYMTKDI